MLGEGSRMLHRRRVLAEAGLREHIERHAVEPGQVYCPRRRAARAVFRPLHRFAAVGVGHELVDRSRADLLARHLSLDFREPSSRLTALQHRLDDLDFHHLPDRMLNLHPLGRHLHELDHLERL